MRESHQRPQKNIEFIKEAERLRAIFEARKREFDFSQESFAQENDLNSQQVVYQYLSGRIALNLIAAARFAKGLLCSISDFSPRLAKELESMGLVQRGTSYARPTVIDELSPRSPRETRLLLFYRDLGKEGKALLNLWTDHFIATRSNQIPMPEVIVQAFNNLTPVDESKTKESSEASQQSSKADPSNKRRPTRGAIGKATDLGVQNAKGSKKRR